MEYFYLRPPVPLMIFYQEEKMGSRKMIVQDKTEKQKIRLVEEYFKARLNIYLSANWGLHR